MSIHRPNLFSYRYSHANKPYGPTLRAVDAAGAARGLGAIFGGGAVPLAVPVYGGCQRRN